MPEDKEYLQSAVFIRSDAIGHADEELGKNLMMNFLHQLSGNGKKPDAIILMNSAVKLACENSEVLESLQDLEKKGVQLLACGTCLDYFHVRDKQRAGRASNIIEITDILLTAKVVTV